MGAHESAYVAFMLDFEAADAHRLSTREES